MVNIEEIMYSVKLQAEQTIWENVKGINNGSVGLETEQLESHHSPMYCKCEVKVQLFLVGMADKP